ncbi:MAG: adenosylcobinamide-GDP ribazoletransferase [Lachnospiraceae bacterium]|nr:adenosylcobinamide-GDP ribazoletransferase [Lachnospiraceae bacterium]
MKIIRNMIVALSMYSRIPMPVFSWKEDDTKYALGFIGLVGVIIGAMEYGVYILGEYFALPLFVRTLLWATIPLVVTGGFHVDGFMDVQDALNSYKPKEEKLKILKDPHVGAFAIISLVVYGCFYFAGTYLLLEAGNRRLLLVVCLGFACMRAVGAFLGVVLRHAKQEGLLHEETKQAATGTKVLLLTTILLCLAGMVYLHYLAAAVVTLGSLLLILWYRHKCYKEFGGVSGDAIGFFITVSELLVVIFVAVVARVI